MKKIFLSLGLVLLVIGGSISRSEAEESMRRCMLLPIQDSVGGALGYEVFKHLESYLRNSDWCYYESNSPVLDILANYRQNLSEHLENPEVLRVISERTRAGSLIRINIDSMVDGVELTMSIVGSNGEDLFFQDEERLETDDPERIARTLRNWLNEYEGKIPYDGRVLGVLGDQFTIEIGGTYGVLREQEMDVVRPMGKQRHPLLGEIVDWETQKIATARAFQVGVTQTQARVREYTTNRRVEPKDWVILKRDDGSEEDVVQTFERDGEHAFGRLGTLGVGAIIGRGSNNVNDDNDSKRIGGFNFGVHIDAEVWATRHYWVGLEVGRKFGSYSPQEGDFISSSNSVSSSLLKIKTGYKYLPMGFFYGPQVDAYLGYARYSYGFDNRPEDGITAVRYSGLLMGVRGSLPIHELFRVKMELDFIFSPSFTEDVNNFGTHDSVSSFNLKLGGSYIYQQNMTFDASISYTSNKTDFNSGDKTDIKNTDLLAGVTFTF